jgi:hypothetical protein
MGEMLVRKVLVSIAVFTAFPLLLAQQILDNDSVMKMVKMGFQDDMIVNTINHSQANFDTSMDGMIALKNGGVDNKIMSAMVVKMNIPSPAAAPVETVSTLTASPVSAPAPPASAAISTPVAAPRAPYAPPAGKPRIFLESTSHGNLWNATRDQSMEMSKDFEQACPDVRISINQQAADYIVALNHIEHGLVRDNQIQVANRDGDLIARTKEGGSIKSRVKSACNDILTDWASVKR